MASGPLCANKIVTYSFLPTQASSLRSLFLKLQLLLSLHLLNVPPEVPQELPPQCGQT